MTEPNERIRITPDDLAAVSPCAPPDSSPRSNRLRIELAPIAPAPKPEMPSGEPTRAPVQVKIPWYTGPLVLVTTTLAVAVLVTILLMSKTKPPGPLPPPPPIGPGGGLALEALRFGTVTISGSWVEEDNLINDQFAWSGTAVVAAKSGDKLWLYTNSHCLGLADLAKADIDGSPEVLQYGLVAMFSNGEQRPVLRVAEEISNLDLGILEVAAGGLSEGKDYTIIPYNAGIHVGVGDPVVAVGNPLGNFPGTHTFGKISAFRDQGSSGERCRVIQHDAAINHGNSGGPLFVEGKDGRYYWVGVNTWGIDPTAAQGIYFSIAAAEANDAKYVWAEANASGAAKLISELRNVTATVSANAK